MTVRKAANKLGVTTQRVYYLLEKGLLEGNTESGCYLVTTKSVNSRLEEKPKSGRPKGSFNE